MYINKYTKLLANKSDRKGILPVRTCASKPLGMAVNTSEQVIAEVSRGDEF